jgi:hypothetical protein
MGRRNPDRLRREIAVLLVVKALVLAALWFACFRGHEVAVDAGRAAGLFGLPAQAGPAVVPSGGKSHGE